MQVVPFLDRIAAYLASLEPALLRKTVLVFPNRRASLYLKNHLARHIQKPIWVPAIFSIEDFITRLSGYDSIGDERLIMQFYRAYLDVAGDKAQALPEFLDWADTALRDFNDIDLYLVKPGEIFSYLSEMKAMALWNPGRDEFSPFEKEYLRFFNDLGKLYDSLSVRLTEGSLLSQGLIYRYVAEHIDTIASALNWEQVIFAGFNALSKAEELITTRLKETGKAVEFFDADHYYLDDEYQEAGHFLRKRFKESSGEVRWICDDLSGSSKHVEIISVPKLVIQAKVAGTILSGIPEHELNETAVILGREEMLIPLLNSLPEHIPAFNVTMGFSLKYSPAGSLAGSYLQLLKTAWRYLGNDQNTGEDFFPGAMRFYHRELANFLDHPYITGIWSKYETEASIRHPLPSRLLAGHNRPFYSLSDLNKLVFPGLQQFNTLLQELFDIDPRDYRQLTGALHQLIARCRSLFEEKTNGRDEGINDPSDLENEFLCSLSLLLNRIANELDESGFQTDLQGFIQLYAKAAAAARIPFYGEPLQGVQIMGLLETRTLDFKHLILLNVNEDILPSGRTVSSFIPWEIRNEFGLPTYRESQAVFAYHFYRLLQRARNIYLLYDSVGGELGGGDKSRFLSQIIREWPLKNPGVKIVERTVSMPTTDDDVQKAVSVTKTEDVMENIRRKFRKGISATTLNAFLSCPLRFYFTAVEELEETAEVEEKMEAGTFGQGIHKTLEILFRGYAGKTLDGSSFGEMKNRLDASLYEGFHAVFPEGDLDSGKNHLLIQAARALIRKYLDLELKHTEDLTAAGIRSVILHLEKRLKYEFRDVCFHGIADRIDQEGDRLVILDYKTGKVEPSQLKISELDHIKDKKDGDKLIQLLFYSWLYANSPDALPMPLHAAIMSFRNPGAGRMEAEIEGTAAITGEILQRFESFIEGIVSEILDTSRPFSQTEDISRCKYCSFVSICNR